MALTDAFLTTCRTAIAALPELTAFRAALATYGSASRSSRLGYWNAVYGDGQDGLSLAYRLRKAVRDVVNANATSSVSLLERESAYRTLSAEVVPNVERPPSDAEEKAAYETLFFQDLLS